MKGEEKEYKNTIITLMYRVPTLGTRDTTEVRQAELLALWYFLRLESQQTALGVQCSLYISARGTILYEVAN